MKRWTLRIGVFLLLGAIVNVAVAWGVCLNFGLTWSDDGLPSVEDIEWWQATAPAGRDISEAPARVIHSNGFGWQVVYMIELRTTESSQPRGHRCERKLLGWPMHSLQSTIWWYEDRSVALRGIVFFLSKDWPREPLWIGTIVNSVFYGVMLFIPWMGIVALRRGRKKRKLATGPR